MGIITKLLTLPVMGPINSAIWLATKLTEQAENELYNADTVRGELAALELRHDLGEIGEEEYEAAEEVLLERLRVIRNRQVAPGQRP